MHLFAKILSLLLRTFAFFAIKVKMNIYCFNRRPICFLNNITDIQSLLRKMLLIDFQVNHRCDNSFVIQKLRIFVLFPSSKMFLN